jgi:hypothetical protein
MSKVSITGNASGTGTFTLAAPNSNSDRTLTLPDVTGTIVTTGSSPSFPTTIGVGGATPSTSGAGITFPATQSASSDANTLDDYEQGTWTPTVAGGSTPGTYTLSGAIAYYTKIGNQVTAWCSFGFSAASGGSSYIAISGLPFSYKASSQLASPFRAAFLNTSASSSNGIIIANASSSADTELLPLLTIDNATYELIGISGVSTSTNMGFCITYTVD